MPDDTSPLPTYTQYLTIRYFAGDLPPVARATPQTFGVCIHRGWIAKTETFPYHEATDAGKAAVRACEVACVANGCLAILPHRHLVAERGWRVRQGRARCPRHLLASRQ